MTHPTLRFAGLNDIDAILDLAKELYKDSPYSPLSVNPVKVRATLEKIIVESKGEYVILLSVDGQEIVGVLVGYVYSPVFSDDRIAIEMLWYLKPEHRSGNRGVDMMDAYEYWAKGVGAKVIQYGYLSSSPEGMLKLYRRRGFELSEQIFQKVL